MHGRQANKKPVEFSAMPKNETPAMRANSYYALAQRLTHRGSRFRFQHQELPARYSSAAWAAAAPSATAVTT